MNDADLVLLAVPLAQTAAVLAQIAPHLGVAYDRHRRRQHQARRHRACAALSRRGISSRFVPAHPIAGTEKSGARAAFAELVRGHNLIVTPEAGNRRARGATVSAAWKLAGMRMITHATPPSTTACSRWSVICRTCCRFALVGQIAGYRDARTLFVHTGGGFRDTTRIAGSSPEMWRDVCVANRDALLAALDDYLGEFERLRGMVEASDAAGLDSAVFRGARGAREAG